MITYFHFDLAHFREHGGHYVDAVFTFQLVLGVPFFNFHYKHKRERGGSDLE